MISVVTPWHNTPELITTYEPSVMGAEVVIIDNASEPDVALLIQHMTERLSGKYIRNQENMTFSIANNQGYRKTTKDIVVFLNSDISAPVEWLEQVEREVNPGALYGPSLLHKTSNNQVLPYIEGFCIAATRETWERSGLWPNDLSGNYWDDNILCLKAIRNGIKLKRTDWPVIHFSNYTSSRTPGAYNESNANQMYFHNMVKKA